MDILNSEKMRGKCCTKLKYGIFPTEQSFRRTPPPPPGIHSHYWQGHPQPWWKLCKALLRHRLGLVP